MVKKEDGGGIDYAVYIIAIFLISLLVYFLVYQQRLIVVKEELINGLQICESHVLTFAQPEDGANSNIADERERNRSHIITNYVNEEGLPTVDELSQIRMISLEFERRIKERFNLDERGIPHNNTLAQLCAGELSISSFYIYEAVYDSRREITNYICYEINIADGTCSCISKKIVPLDATINGRPLRGSLIYATLDYHLLGPRKLAEESIETNDRYLVSVESCVDIVLHKNY